MPRTTVELCRLTATDLSGLLEKQEVSPLEIVDALLAHIDEADGKVNAFICADPERARTEAYEAERELLAGRRKSALHGIPVAHKDVFDVRGYATTAGSRLTSWERRDRDAAIVARLRDAGAIMLGKTNTTEFAAGTMEVFGETRNPWDLRTTAGTSSAGSAAAVAACMTPLATGSDTGGSIRIPAAYCGVVGFKPAFDTAIQTGMTLFSRSFDTPGFMARCVSDVALLLGYSTALDGSLQGLTLGVPRRYFYEGLSPDVGLSIESALQAMRALGAAVIEIDVPHLEKTAAAFWAIAYTDALATYRSEIMSRHADVTKPLLHRLLAAACLTADELRRAHQLRPMIAAELDAALAKVDAVVTPTAPTTATLVAAPLVHADRNRFTRPANLAGIPALSLPCGFGDAGLPIGLQMMSRKGAEAALLRIASAYERSTEWHKRQAPVSPSVIPSVAAQSVAKSRDSDNSAIMTSLHKQGFSFVTDEMAAAAATALAPVRSSLI